jgi:hypothetical protein
MKNLKKIRKPKTNLGPGNFQLLICRFMLLLLLLLTAAIHAQTFSLGWFTMDSGGGTSTGSVYTLRGTIGQPEAHPATATLVGGNFSLSGGFWSLFAVQTPGAPWLTITLTSTNTALVLWPTPSTGFSLQQNANLNTTNWVGAPETVNDNGTHKFVVVHSPVGKRFYRLLKL